MATVLHITNGESVLHGFQAGRIPGEHLSWSDVLHDGPVPFTPELEDLSEIRAAALAGFGGHQYKPIRRTFGHRDRTLRDSANQDEVVLWFEHDLFDQLQLLQLLDFFALHPVRRLSLIQIDRHPEVEPFYGLGQLSGHQLKGLLDQRARVTPGQLAIGQEAWRAFRASEPVALEAIAQRHMPEMPFLAAALHRFLEEYPSTFNGLSRVQYELLAAASKGHQRKHDLYQESQKLEVCPWGDSSVYMRLDALARSGGALVATAGSYELTDLGKQLLEGEADWIRAHGGLDTWLGGVHLTGPEAEWRWDGTHLVHNPAGVAHG